MNLHVLSELVTRAMCVVLADVWASGQKTSLVILFLKIFLL